MNNAAAVIMPKGKIAPVLTEIVGTGPPTQGGVPDQYIQLVRFDGYKQREGEPDGYGGARKQYLDEIRFVPVSNANTRTEAAGRPVRLRRLAASGIAGQAQGRPLRSGHAQAFRLAAPGAQHQAGASCPTWPCARPCSWR